MKKAKRFLVTVGLITAATLTGCGSGKSQSANVTEAAKAPSQAATPETGNAISEADTGESSAVDAVSVSVGYDIADLAPWSATSTGRNSVLPTIYEYLAYYDNTQESGMSGILMKDFEQVDAKTFHVTIYDYIHDSQGNPLTAEDVAWCFNQWKEAGKSVKTNSLESCTAIDDYTVEIKLTLDSIGEVQNIMCGQVPIVTKAGYEASGDGMIENVISTSPYVVTKYVSGSILTVERDKNYWQTDESLLARFSQHNADEISFHIIGEKAQVAINLQTDVIDIAPSMSYSEASRFMEGGEAADGYTVYTANDPNIYCIAFNCSENGVFENNLELREAVCYAIDTNGLIQGALNGAGEPNKAFANPICADYNEKWDSEEYFEYNPDKASELIEKSGFDKSKTLRIICQGNEIFKSTAQIIQSYLLQVGIQSEILAYDSALFHTYNINPAEWDIMLDTRMSNDYVTSLTSCFIVSDTRQAMGFMVDDKLQELSTSVCTMDGHTEEAVDEYMQYLKDQCYVYGLFHAYNYYVVEDTITGVTVSNKGILIPGACTYSDAFVR
jgi:ABC-type transport system substrate-binding protein